MNATERKLAKAHLKKIFDVYIHEQVYEPSALKEDLGFKDEYLRESMLEHIRVPLFTASEFASNFGHGDTDDARLRMFFVALEGYVFGAGDEPDTDKFFS